jgi:hypothetical protein
MAKPEEPERRGRKPLSKPFDERWVKFSMLLQPELHQQVLEAAQLHGVDRSDVIRACLRDHVQQYGPHSTRALSKGLERSQGHLELDLPAEVQQALFRAGEAVGVPPEGVVALLLQRHLGDFLREAEEGRRKLREQLAGGDQSAKVVNLEQGSPD